MTDEMTDEKQTTIEAVAGLARRDGTDEGQEKEWTEFSTGVVGRLRAISPSLLDDARAAIDDPDVPVVYIEEKDREEPNPADPEYQKAVKQAERDRNTAVIDAMILFGVELRDPVPADPEDGRAGWVRKLQFLKIASFDPDDEFERELAYKKYVATGTPELERLIKLNAISEEELERAARTF